MKFLDFLFTAASVATGNTYQASKAITDYQSNAKSDKATTYIDKYYMHKYIKTTIDSAYAFRVLAKNSGSMKIEVIDYNNRVIRTTTCCGDGVSPSYEVGGIYYF